MFRTFQAVSVIGILAWLLVSPAIAQVCGDADGDGSVTVNDGVQTLRAAAFLSSSCSPQKCDVDGSGTITVNDGVNVLRKAAVLSAPNACPGGGVNQEVETVVSGTIAPFLIFGFNGVTDVSIATAAGANQDNCPLGG